MAARKILKTRGTKRALSTERVLEAALALADAEGLEALSMRSLAQRLKVEAMSLYNHVANKEAILDGLVELVVREITLPELCDDWRYAMRTRALSAHAVLQRHPWATMLFVSRINVGPHMLRYVDTTVGCLCTAGFSYAQADHAWNAIDAYVYGFTLHKLNFPIEPEQYAHAAAQFLPLIPPDQYPHMHGLAQEVISGRHNGVNQIELGLDVLLDGLERARTCPG